MRRGAGIVAGRRLRVQLRRSADADGRRRLGAAADAASRPDRRLGHGLRRVRRPRHRTRIPQAQEAAVTDVGRSDSPSGIHQLPAFLHPQRRAAAQLRRPRQRLPQLQAVAL